MTGRVRFLKQLVIFLPALFLVIVAAPLHLEQAWLMATALILLPLISYALGWLLMRSGLACERVLPDSCREGEYVRVTVIVRNDACLPKFFLRVRDRLPRWVRPAGGDSGLILHLNRGESSPADYTLEAEKRGLYQIGPAQVLSTDPFGLYAYLQTVPGTSELLVYPTVVPIGRVFWEGASAHGWREQDRGRSRGGGTDFQGVREYRTGDELRRVHWRTTARTGALAVAEYAQGFTSTVVIALDLSRRAYADTGRGRESALEYGIRIAASLCDYLLRQGSAVRLLLPDEQGRALPPTSDSAQMTVILDALARAEAESLAELPETLARYQTQAAPGMTLVAITPQPDSPALASALDQYGARGAACVVFGLDGASFGDGPAPAPGGGGAPAATRSKVVAVRCGDDLARVIEGGDHARP